MLPIKKLTIVTVSMIMALSMALVCSAYDGSPPDSVDIVYIVDVSGSMDRTDKDYFVRDALDLGIDLAPENSRLAIIALSSEVVSETELTDVSNKENRESLKGYVKQLQNKGNTNIAAGLDRALEILNSSYAFQKRIILLGDFSEGGFNAGSKNQEAEAVDLVDNIVTRAQGSGITVDMILWEKAPDSSVMAPKALTLPQATGGRLFELSDSSRIPASVEDIYFQNFKYQQYAKINVRGEGGQALNVPMPTQNVRRARIYVSAQAPVNSFGASYSGANLSGEQNHSYSMVDLINPSVDGINLTLSPGEAGEASIYLLLEYNPVDISVSHENELVLPEGAKYEIQVSTINVEIVDTKTGKPLLEAPYSDNVVYEVEISSPEGRIPVEYDPANPTMYSFSPDLPEEFGTYQITANLTVGDIVFGPFTSSVEIEDIRPVVDPINWPLIIAITVAALLIIAAIIIASRRMKRMKKEAELQGAVEMASDYKFHGKLYVCAVVVSGGAEEIRPYDFLLHQLQREKRITLKEVLASGRAIHQFPGADDIFFLVGPEESIIVRNNANVTMRVMGKEYGPRSKVQLFYGQKVYIILEKDENELEIYYRKTKEEAQPNINMSRSTSHG